MCFSIWTSSYNPAGSTNPKKMRCVRSACSFVPLVCICSQPNSAVGFVATRFELVSVHCRQSDQMRALTPSPHLVYLTIELADDRLFKFVYSIA